MTWSSGESAPLIEKTPLSRKESGHDGDDEDDVKCGLGPWRPRCLQIAARPRVLLTVICCYSFTNGFVVSGVTPSNTSTLERRYGLPSSSVAWLASSHELAAGFLALLCGWLGSGTTNKGRLLAMSAVVMGIGSLVMTLPHFLSPEYTSGEGVVSLCPARNSSSASGLDVEMDIGGLWPLWVFMAGQCLQAVGTATLHTLAIPYMDDNIHTDSIPLYIGLMFTFQTVGPGLGYVVGGQLLRFYVDIDKGIQASVLGDVSEPGWVGAWWMSYLISSAACFFVALLLAPFPRTLPGNAKKKSPVHGESQMSLAATVKHILSLPPFIFLMIASMLEGGSIFGFNAFFPQILQFQFAQSASGAGLYAGMLTLIGASLGQFLGGVVPHVLRLDVKGLLRQCIVCLLLAGAISTAFLITCPTPPLAGINVPYTHTNTTEMTSPCNQHCHCNTDQFLPVCGDDGLVYFSPCYAGCTQQNQSFRSFSDCSCVDSSSSSSIITSTLEVSVSERVLFGQTVEGYCDQDCSVFYVFIPLFVLLSLIMLTANTGGVTAVTRILPAENKTIGFGIYWTVVRFLGNFPGPIVFGLIIDTSCAVWQYGGSDSQGACWVYDSTSLAMKMTAAATAEKVLAVSCCLGAYVLFRPVSSEQHVITVTTDPQSSESKTTSLIETDVS